MYGQMTAGSWIYIGSQGIVQGTYECFAEIARRRFGGSLAGTITLTAGLGGMGGAQPLAVTMNGGVALCVEVDPERIDGGSRPATSTSGPDDLDDAVARCERAKSERRALSVGLCANAADVLPACFSGGLRGRRRHRPDLRPRSARRATCRTLIARRGRPELRADPEEYVRRARAAIAAHCSAMVGFKDAGAEVFDYGNSLRAEAQLGGFERAFDYPGFVPAYIRPLFCEGKGPFRWVALSGDPEDIAATDRAVLEEFPDDEALGRWIRLAGERIAFQGLPARICWLGYGERARLGLASTRWSRWRAAGADRDRPRPPRLGLGRLALPRDRGDGDGSDAIADWPLLNALVNTAAGASWVSGPPRRRGRHRALDPRRNGLRRGRLRPRGAEARARADHRPRNRRHAPRGCGLRAGRGGGRRARSRDPDERVSGVSVREIVTVGHPVLRERPGR